jgi:hypothetical protein
MDFFVTDYILAKDATLKKPVIDGLINEYNYRHFDNDGFQLNRLEQEYYNANGIYVTECLGVQAAHYPWITAINTGNFIIDHSLIMSRYSYSDEAREQLEKASYKYPYLKKYLLLKPKWGFDFALEYAGENYLEVMHIEQDFDSYHEAVNCKVKFEQLVIQEDWAHFVSELEKRRAIWEPLQGMARNDWKARFWGFDKAERTLKAF